MCDLQLIDLSLSLPGKIIKIYNNIILNIYISNVNIIWSTVQFHTAAHGLGIAGLD